MTSSIDQCIHNALKPQSNFLKMWHQVLLIGVLYEFFAIPFLITFKPHATLGETPEALLVYMWEMLLFADLFVNFKVFSFEGGQEHNAWFKYAFSSGFALDAIAIIPFSVFPIHTNASKMVLEVAKFFRLRRIPRYLSILDDIYATHFALLKLVKLLIGIIFVSHFVACVRFSFGFRLHETDDEWLPEHHDQHVSAITEYLMSLFWAFGLLSGFFEGELPYTLSEFLFTIIVAICGFSLFTALCATLFLLSKCKSGHAEAAEARINQLKHLLSFHQVPENVQAQAVEYMKLHFTDEDSNDREVMKLLCPSIARDIQVELMKDLVARVPLFIECSEAFVIALTSMLDRIALPAFCTLFQVGDSGDAMYLIHSGVLDVIINNVKVRELRKNDFVGELSLVSNRPRSATVVTTTYCVLFKLGRSHTEKVLEGYPHFANPIAKAVDKLNEKIQHFNAGEVSQPEEVESISDKHRDSLFSSQLKRLAHQDTALSTLFKKHNVVVPNRSVIKIKPVKEDFPSEATSSKLTNLPHGNLRRVFTTEFRKASKPIQTFYGNYLSPTIHQSVEYVWWYRLLLRECVDAESPKYIRWVIVLQGVLIYNWFVIPLQLAFPLLNRPWWFIYMLNFCADLILWIDIYVNLNLSFVHNAEKIRSPKRSAPRYVRAAFLLDLICVLPYWLFVPSNFAVCRLPHLLRTWRIKGYIRHVDKVYPPNNRRQLTRFGILLLFLIHIVACLYFSVTYLEGFSLLDEAWIPSDDANLHKRSSDIYEDVFNVTYSFNDPYVAHVAATQYLRSLYYASNVLTGLGKTVEPKSDAQYFIALIFMLSGFIITGIIVDNVQTRVTASALEQKEFFSSRSRIQLFLRRQNAPFVIHHRVNSFLDFWWASHRGALIHELIADLPPGSKREILRCICKPALQTLSLLACVRPYLNKLEDEFVDNAEFVLFGQGEVLYRQGDNAHGLFFLLNGVVSLTTEGRTKEVSHGGCFGTRSLQQDNELAGYDEDAVAHSSCVVIFFSVQKLEILHEAFPSLEPAIASLEKRLRDNKMSKVAFGEKINNAATSSGSSALVRWLRAQNSSLDPDSSRIMIWETLLFMAMTVQWVLVMYHTCYGVAKHRYVISDCITIFLETFFLMDIYVRSRLGFHEFGNKILDIKIIRRTYFRSATFAIDLIALLPLFAINWMLAPNRVEMLNINKLVRLLKVPTQIHALEQRYLKLVLELRLFKLAYYTFLLSHLMGCIYFNFASHASSISSELPTTSFGSNGWMPSESLEHASVYLRYFSPLFWSFALMSASQQGERPKTIGQCLFTVIVMTVGFFLFAYVVGNFTDIIELSDAENREFNAKMGSVRHLLAQFTLPTTLSDKLKTFFFFKRYHSITQEELLERCLPPSLMTDIRLLNLRSMIEKVPFLGHMEASITRMLVSQFRQVLILKDEYVYKYGDDGSDMYFVFTGILVVLTPFVRRQSEDAMVSPVTSIASRTRASSVANIDIRTLKKMHDLAAGDFFGENALFSDIPRNAYVRCKTSCILYSLSRRSLDMVFDLYPDWKKRVLQTMKVTQKQQRLHPPPTRSISTPTVAIAKNHRLASNPMWLPGLSSHRSGFHSSRQISSRDSSRQNIMQTSATSVFNTNKRQSATGWQRFAPIWLVSAVAEGMEPQSWLHILWLKVVTCSTVYIAIVVPYRIAFDPCLRWYGLPALWNLLEILCTPLFMLDIWFNWRMKESEASMEVYEENYREAYRRDRLRWDVLAVIPLDYLLIWTPGAPWFQLTRCFKLLNMVHYMDEINRQSVSYESARLTTICTLYLLAMYWAACAYLTGSIYSGYGHDWNSWTPSEEIKISSPPESWSRLMRRLLRAMFFAVTAFVKKGRTFAPETTGQIIFAILICFVGLLAMAFMIGELASLYIGSISNEVTFRKHHIALERFLARWKISSPLRHRVHLFLSTMWSSHSGINYQVVLEGLPSKLQRETLLHIARVPLTSFMERVFRPVVHGDIAVLTHAAYELAGELRFEGYPRGEKVITEGTISRAMYFVIKGHLAATSVSAPKRYEQTRYTTGQFFGEHGILIYAVSDRSVTTADACDLLSLRPDALERLLQKTGVFRTALWIARCTVKALLERHAGRLPTTRVSWGHALKEVLQQQQTEWNHILTSSVTAQLPKGARAWQPVLADLLNEDDAPQQCLDMFQHFLRLILPCDTHILGVANAIGSRTESPASTNKLRGLVRNWGLDKLKTVAPRMSVHSSRHTSRKVEVAPAGTEE